MSLLAFSNNKQQRKQKVYGVPSAFSCFSSKKILSSIGKKDAIKKNDKYFEKIKQIRICVAVLDDSCGIDTDLSGVTVLFVPLMPSDQTKCPAWYAVGVHPICSRNTLV